MMERDIRVTDLNPVYSSNQLKLLRVDDASITGEKHTVLSIVDHGPTGTVKGFRLYDAEIPRVVEALLGQPYVTLSEINAEERRLAPREDLHEVLVGLAANRVDPNAAKRKELKEQISKLQEELEGLG